MHADLDTTLQSVQNLTQRLGLSDEMAVVQADHDKLGAIEAHALAAMQQEQWQQAYQLLFDNDYLLTKKIYEINSETAVGVLTAELGAAGAARYASAPCSAGLAHGRSAAAGWRERGVLAPPAQGAAHARATGREIPTPTPGWKTRCASAPPSWKTPTADWPP